MILNKHNLKIKAIVLTSVVTLLILTSLGCGAKNGFENANSSAKSELTSEVKSEIKSESKSENKSKSKSKAKSESKPIPKPESIPNTNSKVTNPENDINSEIKPSENEVVRISFDTPIEMNRATITAYNENNEVVWTYETPEFEAAQLSRVNEIGSYGNSYYFVQNGSVVALNLQTGEILWKNDDFMGSSIAFAFGDNAFYLCGYFRPDFYAIDYNGNTLARIDSFDPDYFWAFDIQLLNGQAAVSLEGNSYGSDVQKTFLVDLESYEISSAD